MTGATGWTWWFPTGLRGLVRAVAGRPSLSSRITSTLRPAICQPLSCQYSSQPLYMSLPAAAIAPVSGEMKPILIGPSAAAAPGATSAAAASRRGIFGGGMGGLVHGRGREALGGG